MSNRAPGRRSFVVGEDVRGRGYAPSPFFTPFPLTKNPPHPKGEEQQEPRANQSSRRARAANYQAGGGGGKTTRVGLKSLSPPPQRKRLGRELCPPEFLFRE